MGVDSATSATWRPLSSGTSTRGSHTRRRFGWGYVAMNATLWIDQRDHFSMEHLEEWAKQKEQECALNDLERDTEVVYRARIIRMQEDKALTDSKEAAAKDLLP